MGTCGQATWKQPMPQGFGVHHALNPDPYRGAFGNDGAKYAEDVADLIQSATPGKARAVASIIGPCVALGEGPWCCLLFSQCCGWMGIPMDGV